MHSYVNSSHFVFKDTWIGTNTAKALFPSEHWTSWRSVLDRSIPTTTAGSEGYNSHLKR